MIYMDSCRVSCPCAPARFDRAIHSVRLVAFRIPRVDTHTHTHTPYSRETTQPPVQQTPRHVLPPAPPPPFRSPSLTYRKHVQTKPIVQFVHCHTSARTLSLSLIKTKNLYFFFPVKEIANGRSPLLQDPLFGSRPQPYSKCSKTLTLLHPERKVTEIITHAYFVVYRNDRCKQDYKIRALWAALLFPPQCILGCFSVSQRCTLHTGGYTHARARAPTVTFYVFLCSETLRSIEYTRTHMQDTSFHLPPNTSPHQYYGLLRAHFIVSVSPSLSTLNADRLLPTIRR